MRIWRQKINEWRKLYSQRNPCFYLHFLLLTIWQVCKSTISNSALQRFFTMMAYYMKAKTNAYQSVSSILHNMACLYVKLSSHLFFKYQSISLVFLCGQNMIIFLQTFQYSSPQPNVRPPFFYTKPFVYNSVAICLIMIKLIHHTF